MLRCRSSAPNACSTAATSARKLAQEELIKAGGIPYTIVRATQFFEFIGAIAESGADGETVRLSPALMQPIAVRRRGGGDGRCGTGRAGERHDRGGRPRSAAARRVRPPVPDRNGRPAHVIADAQARYYGIAVNDQSLTPGANPRLGKVRFGDWLRQLALQDKVARG